MPNQAMEQVSANSRLLAAVLGLTGLTLGLGLAGHYPIMPEGAVVLFCMWAGIVALFPTAWLLVVPVLLPLIGFAPWTGWLTFEELDLLVLGTAAGAYARHMLRPAPSVRSDTFRTPRLALRSKLLLALLLTSTGIALYRGIQDAGGLRLGWFQGYDDPLNSLRLAKSLVLAMLLSPLLRWQLKQGALHTLGLLSAGLILGLAGAGMAALWERAAFPGVLDFSSDYRTTALFWEMHVGGAALDGFLALTLPFALYTLLRTHSRIRWLGVAAVLLLATYVCLTTFSRGVYLSVAIALAVIALGHFRQAGQGGQRPTRTSLLLGGILTLLAVTAMQLVFHSGGYRSMLTVLGVVLATFPLGVLAKQARAQHWLIALFSAALLALAGFWLATLLPKGPYLVFGVALLGTLLALFLCWQTGGRRWLSFTLIGYLWTISQAAGVAWHWGGNAALEDSLMVQAGILLLLAWRVRSATPLWPDAWRAQGTLFGIIMLISGTVAVLGGGSYMAGRFSTSEKDMGGRLQHWSTGLSLLHGNADWLWGKGFGRFPTNYLYGASENAFPGSYRVATQDGNAHLTLAGPRHVLGFGELFRISQRVPLQREGSYKVALDVRLHEEAALHLEVCEKHLLYSAGCALQAIPLKPLDGRWQQIAVTLDGQALTGGPWYAPRLGFFSMAVDTRGKVLEIDNVRLEDATGRSILHNGDFSREMARWFFTSDRQHLPWHIKNLFLNVLFDQGWFGLLIFLALTLAGLWRLLLGAASSHPISPYLAASLLGFLVVGAFDSLLDVPRDAFLFYLLLLLALFLPGLRPGKSAATPPAQ